jgi:tetratricopeptide (TPR) repeat protein
MLSLLEEFAAQSTLAAVKRSCQQGITRSLLARYQQAAAPQRNQIRQELMQRFERDPANGLLAFLLACISVENGATRAAINVLSRAQSEDSRQQRVFSSFLNLLDGRQLTLKEAPHPAPGASSKLQLAYELLRIAIAFAAKRLEVGYEGLTQVLRQSPQDAQTYVKMERLFPLLCAYLVKGGAVPDVITDTLRRLVSGQVDVEQASMLANCAAAIGEYETACSLWQKAIALEQGQRRKTCQQDYAKLLCHLAVVAKRADDDLEAIRRLRQAAVVLEESVAR